MDYSHKPVMLEEVLNFLPDHAKIAVDLTIGGGSHAAALLGKNHNLFLYGVDRDAEAISASKKKLTEFPKRFELWHQAFAHAAHELREQGVKADFIIADLGVSSRQLDNQNRGFSFRMDGPLDMRMNQEDPITAEEIVNKSDEKELAEILKAYGEEHFAKRIARQIVKTRERQKISSTRQLAECIEHAVPAKYRFGRIHSATRTFQALRIKVNHEIEELKALLDNLIPILNPGGRVAIITFHSLEDRPVKQIFRSWTHPCKCPTEYQKCICGLEPMARLLNKKIIKASIEETDRNPRSRSAKLRVAEKI